MSNEHTEQKEDMRPKKYPSFTGLLSDITYLDPDKIFAQIRGKVTVEKFKTPTADTPQPPNTLRLVCISDTHSTHGLIPELPKGDVLVHAGDFTEVGMPADIDAFCSWLGALEGYKHKVVIAGNHDLSLEASSYPSTFRRFGHRTMASTEEQIEKLKSVCTYLDHSAVDIEGVRFFGSPYQPWFYDWAFNLDRGEPCRSKWASMPTDVDVLITHGPPLGHGDLCVPGNNRAGCADLLDWVEAHPPKVHIFGHIHEGYGVTTNNKTIFINASTLDERYDKHHMNAPVVFDVPLPAKSS